MTSLTGKNVYLEVEAAEAYTVFHILFLCSWYVTCTYTLQIYFLKNLKYISFNIFFFIFSFYGHTRSVWKLLWLGVEPAPQLQAWATATAAWDPSCFGDLLRSLQQCWILNLPSGARDQTGILQTQCRILNPLSHTGNSLNGHFSTVTYFIWMLCSLILSL